MADLGTELDISHLAPETRAADVAEILGLAAATAPEGAVLVDGVVHCAACRQWMPRSGSCRRLRQCRIVAADRGLL